MMAQSAAAPLAASSPSSLAFTGAVPAAPDAAWLAGIDTFLLDCDGVLWRGSHTIPGVDATVAWLRSLGKRVFYVTNNSTKSRRDVVDKLSSVCGIAALEEEVVSSAYAAALGARARGIKKAYVIGEKGLVAELEAVGIQVVGPGDETKPFGFGGLSLDSLDPGVEAVIAGFDGTLSYYKLAMGASYIRYRHAVFIATNRDATFPDAHMLLPGGGTVVQALETGSGKAPDLVAGKPSPGLLQVLEASVGLDRTRTVMVGDRLDTDILFGNAGGLHSTLLVMTGVTSAAALEALAEADPSRPTHVTPSFGGLRAHIEGAATA